jgi:hypothetical protein
MLRISYATGTLFLLALLAACGGYDEGRDYGPTGPTYPDPPPDNESTSSGEGEWNY